MKRILVAVLGMHALFAGPVLATDLVGTRMMSLELATEIAQGAIDACREMGYQVSVVVVDRAAQPQVVMRDVYSTRFTVQLATEKANSVILGGVSSAELRRNRGSIVPELNEVDGILVLAGALPIRAAGQLVGAVGVSGAPGGDKDEICAAKGIEKVAERLEFAD